MKNNTKNLSLPKGRLFAQKPAFVFIAILLVLLGGMIGYFIGTSRTAQLSIVNSDNPLNSSDEAILKSNEPSNSPKAYIDTGNWKTLKVASVNESFKYPPNWICEEDIKGNGPGPGSIRCTLPDVKSYIPVVSIIFDINDYDQLAFSEKSNIAFSNKTPIYASNMNGFSATEVGGGNAYVLDDHGRAIEFYYRAINGKDYEQEVKAMINSIIIYGG